jgi:photosystem II stability/assembly factor-like uncharacterized protein
MALAALLLGGCKGTGTHLVVPTPPAATYTSINPVAMHALSARDIWIAGDLTTVEGTPEGLILWTDDGGKRWRRAGSEIHDLGNLRFTSIFFIDRLRGWIGGKRVLPEGQQRAVVFRTKDGGNHWTEATLPARDDSVIEDLHSIAFRSDNEGEVLVSFRDSKTSEVKESIYQTNDGGRAWTVSSHLQEPKAKTDDRSVSYFNAAKTNGYRLTRSPRAGVTVLEVTASSGKDWMPVSEFSLSYIPTFY